MYHGKFPIGIENLITRECLDQIKNTVDLYDVVSPYVNLKRCGANWRGLSPFSSEKTPSFFIMSAKKMFKCFSSGNAGDIFRFIQLKENVSFSEAVEIIADRFNISLKFDSKSDGQPAEFSRRDFFAINELVNAIFVKNFQGNDSMGQKIRHYWVEIRQFNLETANKHGIGLCKNDEKHLIEVLVKRKFTTATIGKSGLFYSKDWANLSAFRLRFRNRLTIPIRDIQGRIIGFAARAVDGITSDGLEAKYVNSPETPIFHKGDVLFGLYEARLHVSVANQFWLVEGQLDVFRCWEAGMLTAIAPQGTAITDVQLSMLRRYSPNLNCMLDGDDAGLRAADRLLRMAMAAGLEVKFYTLPKGEDPDSFFRGDGHDRDSFFKTGVSAMEFAIKRHFPVLAKMSSRQKADALQNIYEIIANADSAIVHESLLDEVSQICGFDRRAIAQDFATFRQRRNFNNPMPIKLSIESEGGDVNKLHSAESQLLSVVLSGAKWAKKISKILSPDLIQSFTSPEANLLAKVLGEVAENLWEGAEVMDNSETFSGEEKNIAYSVLADFSCDGDCQALVNLCLSKLHYRYIREKIVELDAKINRISLDEKEMLRNLQHERMCLRESLSRPPQIDASMAD
ncbi:MAG: DNA primase [Puniceicoccales bacterium]|jgi:DNA primase|nr:DNA primase [Puniceicoccales bacterium]